MKIIELAKSGDRKLRSGVSDLFRNDIVSLAKSFLPGEWAIAESQNKDRSFLAMTNITALDSNPVVRIVRSISIDERNSFLQDDEQTIAKREIEKGIDVAIGRRALWKDDSVLVDGGRLVFGSADGLPGLIIDIYQDLMIVQINTAGIDRMRTGLQKKLHEVCPEKKIMFLDNPKYRLNENLPVYEDGFSIDEIKVKENGFNLVVNGQSLQKIGYYYDHRCNRLKMETLLNRLRIGKKRGVDLFCYVGLWGLHMLRAGVSQVDFVDQGDLEGNVSRNLELNSFAGKGSFFREDVFSFLKTRKGEQYDVVCSDPPAFSKSMKTKQAAVQGYLKLHKLLFDIVAKNGLMVVASCTHGIDYFDLSQTVLEASKVKNRKVTLVDIGMQAPDHPVEGLQDRSFYLKYLAYIVE